MSAAPNESESELGRLSGCGTNAAGLDSHRFGLDGIRLRGGAFWALSAGVSGCRARRAGTIIRSVAVVWDGTHRSRSAGKRFFGMAPCAINSRPRSRRHRTLAAFDSACSHCFLPGAGWAGDGNLSAPGSQFNRPAFLTSARRYLCRQRLTMASSTWPAIIR